MGSTYFHTKIFITRLLEKVCAEEAVGIVSKTELPHIVPQKRIRSDDLAGLLVQS